LFKNTEKVNRQMQRFKILEEVSGSGPADTVDRTPAIQAGDKQEG
jgi:hypothetical protein